MAVELWVLFLVALGYLALLFVVAYAAERGWLPTGLTRHPVTLALSLGVYATTWTYYGSVGFADLQGYLFLTIYLGVTLAILLWPVLLTPLQRLVRNHQLQSLADLFEFRFPGRYSGLLVTVFMLIGVLPYLSLQIRAVTASVEVLTRQPASAGSPWLGAAFCALATLFAVLFGARQLEPRERHEGLVVAIAFESLVKLFALLTVTGVALFGVFGGVAGLQHWLAQHPQAVTHMFAPVGDSAWTTLLLLSFSAAFLLPRQFHMLFVENPAGEDGLRTASWLFPLFLLLLNLPIPLILWAGRSSGLSDPPDYFLLALAQQHGGLGLTLLAFAGGISAASAMLIVESLALAGMCLNHIVLPLWLWLGRRGDGDRDDADLYLRLRRWRRLLLAAVIATGYLAYVVMRQNQELAQMGLISFVAVAQFLPGVLAMLLWPRVGRDGVIAGICGGMAVWAGTLAWPLLTGHLADFGIIVPAASGKWPFLTFWSLAINGALLIGGSLLRPPGLRETAADQAIRFDATLLREQRPSPPPAQLHAQLAVALGADNARREVQRALDDCGLPDDEWRPQPLQRLEARIERNLSGLLGPHLARRLLGSDAEMRAAAPLIDAQLEQGGRLTGLAAELDHLRRLHRQVLRDLPVGACAVDEHGVLRLWNHRLETLSGLGEDSVIGLPTAQLPSPWATLLGEFLCQRDAHLYKIELRLPAGGRWLNLHKESVGPDAAASGVVVLLEDLTEQRLLEAELAHTERLASIGTFAAGVAHEIGNPLTGIHSLAQNLRLDSADPDIHSVVDEILQQGRRIQEIVRSLLVFSRAGAGPAPNRSRFEAADCARQAIRLAQFAAGARELRFELEMAGPLALHGDRDRLLQALVNVLLNAVDAAPAGSLIHVQGSADSARVTLTVTDQGDGIPEPLRQRVFEPFFTTKPPGRGTGLGLPLVYGIVRDHGGSVHLDSAPGGGTRVSLHLPNPATSETPTA